MSPPLTLRFDDYVQVHAVRGATHPPAVGLTTTGPDGTRIDIIFTRDGARLLATQLLAAADEADRMTAALEGPTP